jgi:hypothetical protein
MTEQIGSCRVSFYGSSKPVRRRNPSLGRFDSCAAPSPLGTAGNLASDAHVAALEIEHGAGISYDPQ